MRYQKILSAFGALVVGFMLFAGSTARADSPGDGFKIDFASITAGYRSQYTLSNGGTLSDDPIGTADLFVGFKNGFTLDLWTCAPITDLGAYNDDYRTEFDLTFGYLTKVGDYDLKFSASYYDLNAVGSWKGNDMIELMTGVYRKFNVNDRLSIAPFAEAEMYFIPDGSSTGDTFLILGARADYAVTKTVDAWIKTKILYDPGIAGGDTALVGNAEGGLCFKLSDHVSIEAPYLKYTAPITNTDDARTGEFVWGMSLTYKF